MKAFLSLIDGILKALYCVASKCACMHVLFTYLLFGTFAIYEQRTPIFYRFFSRWKIIALTSARPPARRWAPNADITPPAPSPSSKLDKNMRGKENVVQVRQICALRCRWTAVDAADPARGSSPIVFRPNGGRVFCDANHHACHVLFRHVPLVKRRT